jgi:hypothetical protein
MTVEGHNRDNLPHAHGTIWIRGAQSPINLIKLINPESPAFNSEYRDRFITYIDQHLCASCPGIKLWERSLATPQAPLPQENTYVSKPWSDKNFKPPRTFATEVQLPSILPDARRRIKGDIRDPHPSAWHPPDIDDMTMGMKELVTDFDHCCIVCHTNCHHHTETCYQEDI